MTKQYETGLSLYLSAIAILGGNTAKAAPLFDAIWQSGSQSRRYFHNPSHYLSVGGVEDALNRKLAGGAAFENAYQALRFKAGCEHDVAYVHIDRKDKAARDGFAPLIRQTIEQVAHISFHSEGAIRLRYRADTLNEQMRLLIAALNGIFGHTESALELELQWYNNQNEYLSALFSLLSGLEVGLPEKHLLAQLALIEATVPFGAPGRLPALKGRLLQANSLCDNILTAAEIDNVMREAEALSNKDVSDFEKYFGDFIDNSFLLLLENSIGEVSLTDAYRIDPVMMATAMSGMADFLSNVADISSQPAPARSIFHLANGARHSMEAHAIQNIRCLNTYLREARTDLQLLINDYANHHQSPPACWGDICTHIGIETASAPMQAKRFFKLLAQQSLREFANFGEEEANQKHLSRISDYLAALKPASTQPHEITLKQASSKKS